MRADAFDHWRHAACRNAGRRDYHAGGVLLDTMPNQEFTSRIHGELEQGDDRVTDLPVWRVGPGHVAIEVKNLLASASKNFQAGIRARGARKCGRR